MHIVMNRFKVTEGQEEVFEEVWRNRESYLNEVPGFLSFKMLKGDVKDGLRLYSSHVEWENKSDFENWVQSDAFKKSHGKREGKQKMPSGVIAGHPQIEVFEVILE